MTMPVNETDRKVMHTHQLEPVGQISGDCDNADRCSPNSVAQNRQRSSKQEGGFVAVTTALMMVVLLLAVALAVDVAIWYARAAQLQRTADAAALAAVTKLPDLVKAQQYANELANQNRVGQYKITMSTIPNAPRALKVIATDPSVPAFFGKMIRKDTSISRSAVAEYVPKITMGSVQNALGTGDLTGHDVSGSTQGFWLAINGYCTPKETGDRYSAAFEGNQKSSGVVSCVPGTGITTNEDFPQIAGKPEYTYVIEVPTAPVTVQVYNPPYDRSNKGIDRNTVRADIQPTEYGASDITTTFNLRDEQANTLTPAKTYYTCGTATYDPAFSYPCSSNGWETLFTINTPGRYHVDVDTQSSQANSYGVNSFALRAYTGGSYVLCSTLSSATCPSVSGAESMSVFAQSPVSRDFYLAQLSPAKYYRGKRIQVQLWDADTGADSVALKQPTTSGWTPVLVSYRTWFPGLTAFPDDAGYPLTGTASPNYEVPIAGTRSALASGNQPPWSQSDRYGDFKFNGRNLSIEFTLPQSYGCQGGIAYPCVEEAVPQSGWWKIRYNASGAVNDRTTWNVQLAGDPVHLIHE